VKSCQIKVPTDDQGRIRPDELPELDKKTLLILQAGNVNSGSFDSFREICQKAETAGAWTHIDGAFGLWASLMALGRSKQTISQRI
jgi:glutamate/tyrosine decarboxylase-like PLP-dependent enzyme